MYLGKKIEALLALEENGKVVKTIRFYLKPKVAERRMCSTTFEKTFDRSSYVLTMNSGKESLTFDTELKPGTPWISINSPEEMDLSDKKFPDFLNSVVYEDHMRIEIQEQIMSFVNGK
ncbi:hypothetical protein KAX35_08475 [candidate division WOR-3 bacterium]|nr:hypothetical protein [candidate division WOR-3 bacterium]